MCYQGEHFCLPEHCKVGKM